MKEIRKTIAKVTSVTYDDHNDCYIANIDATVPVSTWTGSKVVYQEHNYVYIEFGTIDTSEISAGDTITIITYDHLFAESAKFYGCDEFTFSSDGCHNVITAITKP